MKNTEKNQINAQRERESIGEVPFSVMARVAIQLGRQSISNSITAILELVKNAYDADAETVKIRFSGLDTDSPLLVIEDEGIGMDQEQLRQHWLVIGTPNKLSARRSHRKKRVLTGEKGLGRLGLDRLCKQTIIRSFTEEAQNGTELIVDWTKYEEESNIRLEDVTHSLFKISNGFLDPITNTTRLVKKGTFLILYNLRDRWTQEYLKELKKELTLLVSPFAGINDFSIELDSGMGWEDIDGVVGSDYMLQAAEWTITSRINKKGEISYKMFSNQHSNIFELTPTPWRKRFPGVSSSIPQAGPVKFDFYFFPRKNITLGDLSYTSMQIREFLDSNQGIRIYRDGFRVKPYGEPDGTGDWLTLSYRRQQSPQGVAQEPLGGWRVGYNQVVGAVFITREHNPNLIDQTNRESIVEGPGFSELKMFALDAIQFFEVNRQKFEMARTQTTNYETARKKASQSTKASTEAVKKLLEITENIQEQQKQGNQPTEVLFQELLDIVQEVDRSVANIEKSQEVLAKAAEDQQAALQTQKDTLGNLASLGILAATFGHETQGAANVVHITAKDLKKRLLSNLIMVMPDVQRDLEESLEIMIYESKKIETFSKFTLKNIRRDKRSRKDVFVNIVAKQVFEVFSRPLSEKDIKFEITTIGDIPSIKAFQIDWESIFINLITNSIWALEDISAEDRNIRVLIENVDSMIHIVYADSGIGVAEGMAEQIFLPTISTKRNEEKEIIGTGMGLAIVKGFVESYNGGIITVEPRCDLGGAQFHIWVESKALNDF